MFTVNLNSEPLKDKLTDKLDAIKYGRKQALKLNEPTGFIHIEVLDDTPKVVHRDLVLAEEIKRLESDNPKDIVGPYNDKEIDIDKLLQKQKSGKLAQKGQYVLFDDELYQITEVLEDKVIANPIKEKVTTIRNKKVTLKRRPLTLPADTLVLTDEEVKTRLQDKNNDNIRKIESVESEDSADNKDSAG